VVSDWATIRELIGSVNTSAFIVPDPGQTSRIFSAFLVGTRFLANHSLMWALLQMPSCRYFTGPK
jgi:hypothetical protein